jgi:transcription antitermination factor NusG
MASSTPTVTTRETADYLDRVELPAHWDEQHWYASYICAQHEKRVAAELGMREVEHFLPLYSSVRRWKDRRVTLDLPLFPGYVFVRLALRDRLRVLQIPSVVRLVGFNGSPAALPDEEMEILRTGLCQSLRAEPHPFLAVGRRVRDHRRSFRRAGRDSETKKGESARSRFAGADPEVHGSGCGCGRCAAGDWEGGAPPGGFFVSVHSKGF